MSKSFLKLYLKISSWNYSLKNKIINSKNLLTLVFYSTLTIIFQLFLSIFTFPVYLLVSPQKIQEIGFIFPKEEKDCTRESYGQYCRRRKISLGIFSSAGSVFILKVLLIIFVSFFLIGGQTLLALTQDWTFDTAGNYTYDSAKIEVTGGVAQLKNLSVPASGGATNTGFDSNASGWTAVPGWISAPGKTNTAVYVSSGGNPGGYINVNLPGKKNNSSAGYWYQAFTTTASNPTATLNLDWSALTVTGAPSSYHLYAYISTSSGNPVVGNMVWDSGNLAGVSSWAGITQVDIASKVTTPGTYYLKIAAYHTCQTSVDCSTVAGFDNVVLNWSGEATPSYATDRPTINPTTSLTPTYVTSWDGFSETATKNGGEIYYQLSDDDGSTWQYWNGVAWASAGTTNYNIASVINSNIGSFSTTNNKIMWKAFLESNGTQQVILDTVSVTYTENDTPDITNISATQETTFPGIILINYDILDNESDPATLVTYEYSLTGAFAGEEAIMTASTTHASHSGTSGLTASPTGVTNTFVWDARSDVGNIYDDTVYVRLRASDGIGSGAYAISSAFAIDFENPIVSNVSAVQTIGETNVSISYDLSDDTSSDLFIELEISEDSGSTWTATSTSVSGDIGSGVSTGASKTIIWDAGTDFDEQEQSDLRVRVRARDKFQNQGDYATSTDFSVDTVNPVTNVTADLQAQANAGDTAVLIGGSFTETNPNTNDFYVAINGGDYASATAGDSDTATPSDQSTAVGATLDGNDYISKLKITHTDDYGQTYDNENLSPAVSYKYVKPYTPQAPSLSNPVTTQLNLTIVPHVSEATGLEYLIQETTTGDYVQANGTLGASAVWQTDSTWGTVTVNGLTSPLANYIFQVKSRNPSDTAHAASSESAYSATAQITNTAPSIFYGSVGQTTDGTQYVTVNYTGNDGQGDIVSLVAYEYSQDNSNWYNMTEKTGVDSDGISSLVFLPSGSAHDFMWDSGTDLGAVEDSSVYVRLRANDTLVNGSLVSSSAFEIDNVNPITSSVTASQDSGARTVTIYYNLVDANNSLIEIDISEDGGATWTVTDTTVAGDVGVGVTPGTGNTITWNAGTDFSGQYQSDIRVRVRARDTFGNQGSYAESANFSLDTNAPVVSNVSASQDSAADTFTFTYDVSEDAGNVSVQLEVSNDGGSTWTVPTTSASGAIGAGITSGTGKAITWDASVDYNGHEEVDMQIRITADDQFTNSGNNTSSNFSLDTLAPRISGVGASQNIGETNVSISFTLSDINNSLIEIDISEDSGSTWTVTDTSVSGDVGSGIGAGSKTIVWAAGTDFDEEEQADLRVRVRAKDSYEHQSANFESSDFSLDTVNPVTNVTADLQAQANAGDTTVLIGGSFTESNPNTNDFYVAINGGTYGDASAGDTNTATPADKLTAVGVTLDGNDYISKLKITHTDDFGQTSDNENFSVSSLYKYVKPYTPAPPTVFNPTVGTVRVLINLHASETSGLEYAIYESTQDKYVQANGSLGTSPVWQTRGTGAGQWGEFSGVVGGITVNDLTNHSYTYIFQTKSRNTSDVSHAVSSESALSTGASSANQSPEISISSVAQTTNGTQYVVINYTGTDLESESSSLVTYEYSLDNSNWYTMTEKTGVGSSGTSGLGFTFGGTSFNFAWDVGTDLANTEDSSVYVRLQANDGTSDGNITTSSAFVIDTKSPVISGLSATQTLDSKMTVISYTLSDLSSSNVEIDISEDSGSSWTVTDTSVSGDIGAGVSAGSGKEITWNAGADFDNQEQSDVRTRVRALDAFGNQGSYTESSDFSVDTKNPVVSNVSAVQDAGASTVTISYDLSDANNSTIEIDISEDGGSTWNVNDSSVSGDVGAGVTVGAGKSITWNAGADFSGEDQLDMRIRVRATDTYSNESGNVESSNFSLDTLGPNITNVSATQSLGGDNVVITYDLTDNSSVNIEIDISEDGGSTWTVTDTTVTGDIGAGVTQGSAKSITWDAGTDFSGEDQVDMWVRVRGADSFTNSSGNVDSVDFSVDTRAPATNVTANLQAQPNAGETNVLIGGSFTETNPNTNNFYVAINGGIYNTPTSGDSNTASPSNQLTAVGTSLDGNDYISKLKISHSDDYTHSVDNENLSPNEAYVYVKPYKPLVPTANNPQNTSVDVTINPNTSDVSGLEYAIYESSTGNYVQGDGTLGVSAVWQATSTWDTVTVTGLNSPVAQYSFRTKSINSSDTAYATSSESNLSGIGAISNTAPVLSINSVSQQTGGVNYVLIQYTGVDVQNDTNSLVAYEYSVDNTNWSTMTEKTGVGSDGTSGLLFTSVGASFDFAWDSGADLPGVEDSTVYVRLRSSDTLANSNLETSSAFAIDNTGPAVSNITVSQTPGTNNIIFEYDLSDNSGSNLTVELDISEDGGATWDVTDTSVSGNIGSGQSSGVSKTIQWDAGVDFDTEEQSDMQVRIRALDIYGNQGNYETSSDFVVDTKNPVVSNVSAVQSAGTSNIVINYDLTDLTNSGHVVEIDISEDGGATWDVTDTSVSGNIGSGQSTGASKTIQWNAGVDFDNQEQSNLRVRVRSLDYYGNQGAYESSVDFAVDTRAPVVSNVSATQTLASNDVEINYDLSDNSSLNNIEIDISLDGGATWTVTDTSVTGDIGADITSGASKTITWDAGTDLNNIEQEDMRVRVRGTDNYGNIGSFIESSNFSVDTKAPSGLAGLNKFAETDNSLTLNWNSGVADSNFDHYEIWHGSDLGAVQNRTAEASSWDETDDPALNNINTISTVVDNLSFSSNYYVKIWAIDNYGNEASLDAINVYEEETAVVVTPASSFAGSVYTDLTPPGKPLITPVTSPSNIRTILISGLAEPRSKIDLFDNNNLVARLGAVADNQGRFSQNFIFSEGTHNLTVRAIDFSDNASEFSDEFKLVIDTTAPSAPLLQSHVNNQKLEDGTPEFFGTAEPLSQIGITLNGENIFDTQVNQIGYWSFIVPNQYPLEEGTNNLEIKATDQAGNQSSIKSYTFDKVVAPIETVVEETGVTPSEELIPVLTGGITEVITPSLPIPSEAEINQIAEAVELPGVKVPRVVQVESDVSQNSFRFSGTSLPNTDVVVYIHSTEALVYRTKTDDQGVWNIDHSQEVAELSSGEHYIFAVTVDTDARVKSGPSAVNKFVVQKSFWVSLYSLLNLPTTILTLIIVFASILWLHKIKKRVEI